ncbi:hypothetical protein Tco_0598933 [Tanacetum coccineum]
MVACLEKSEENVEFHQIVDFLSTCSINYAHTQIHAIVDGKAVVISESSVRSDLLFNDEDGITCLTNNEIFENLALMGYEQLSTKLTFQKGGGDSVERAITTAASLDVAHDIDNIIKTQTTTMPNVDIPQGMDTCGGHTSGSGKGSMEYHFKLTDNVPPTPYDLPLSGCNTPGSDEGRMELIKELMETMYLGPNGFALKEAKTAQDRVINRLKLRVKRLEKKRKARTPQPMKRRLFKGRVETSTDTSLGEDASKQGRSSDKTKPMFKDNDFDVLNAEQITATGPSHVSIAYQVSTARAKVSVATPSTPPTIATVFDDEDVTMAMAQTLIKMREVKANEIGFEFRNVEEASRPEELAELDRAQIERQRQEEATNAALTKEFDEIQARIDVDALFAIKLQQEEREQFTIKERA